MDAEEDEGSDEEERHEDNENDGDDGDGGARIGVDDGARVGWCGSCGSCRGGGGGGERGACREGDGSVGHGCLVSLCWGKRGLVWLFLGGLVSNGVMAKVRTGTWLL